MTKRRHKSPRTWLKALKSHEYERTADVLADEHGRCCLGVYADICGVDLDIQMSEGSLSDIKFRPPWMHPETELKLVDLNDSTPTPGWYGEDTDAYWETTGVLEHIEKVCIPAYDKWKAKEQ